AGGAAPVAGAVGAARVVAVGGAAAVVVHPVGAVGLGALKHAPVGRADAGQPGAALARRPAACARAEDLLAIDEAVAVVVEPVVADRLLGLHQPAVDGALAACAHAGAAV